MRKRSDDGGKRVRIKPADPFDLVRWLARSQNDPRKAVAELVQNSLDARAKTITITRRRVRGHVLLSVLDDGHGVIPELEREAALHYLATHVGHSRKLNLTPAERHAQVIAGQYGVGLLGFWSVGRHLEIRTRVKGSQVFVLHLEEDRPTARIRPVPARLDAPDTFTEVVVLDMHASAQRTLSGKRLADYLAVELRGQLLAHAPRLTVMDHLARGGAQRLFDVVPQRFVGIPLNLPREMLVDGHPSARLELYVAEQQEQAHVQLACGGTIVADDLAELATLGLPLSPWSGSALTGLIDFPGFAVPPGTRRGVIPNAAAAAFAEALDRLAPAVQAELDRLGKERGEVTDRSVVRELKRALRGFNRRLPQYQLEAARDGGGLSVAPAVATGDNGLAADFEAAVPYDAEALGAVGVAPELFPPGPLARLRLEPPTLSVPLGGERRIRAVAEDADGRTIRRPLQLHWRVEGLGLSILGEGVRPILRAAPDAPLAQQGTVYLVAKDGDLEQMASATVSVDEPQDDRDDGGVPEPEWVSDPGALWRSRLLGSRWEVNDAHEDFLALRADGRARLRYLVALLAKDLVARNYGRPGDELILDRVVEILAHAERNLRGK